MTRPAKRPQPVGSEIFTGNRASFFAGTGVIAGGGVRAVLELAGIRDVLAKSLGTTTPINMLKATVNALESLKRPEEVARIRGKAIEDVLPIRKRNGEREDAQDHADS